MFKLLLDKGFQRFVDLDQSPSKVTYRKDINDPELQTKLIQHILTDKELQCISRSSYCTLEISEDLSLASYSFEELKHFKPIKGQLSHESFENALNLLETNDVLVRGGYVVNL